MAAAMTAATAVRPASAQHALAYSARRTAGARRYRFRRTSGVVGLSLTAHLSVRLKRRLAP